MSQQQLEELQRLQFSDREQVNRRMVSLLDEIVPYHVVEVEVRPLAVSLNSINGFMKTADGQTLFFKTHVETDAVVSEYYNSKVMSDAGYPVIRPIFQATEHGKQVMVYEVVESPTLFDVLREFEAPTGDPKLQYSADVVIECQRNSDRQLLDLYRQSLRRMTAEENADAPVHQLFYHRLTGGRFDAFYRNQSIELPGIEIPYERLQQLTWTINGVRYRHTLAELVERAIRLLHPATATPAVVGHGDAHNGNVFYKPPGLVYFDPAFAGTHDPFLDLTKPLFHNVFAMWMYFPIDIDRQLKATVSVSGDEIHVTHDYAISHVRPSVLNSKFDLALLPIVEELQQRGWLREDWEDYLRSALLCCPLLTMNLRDREKFTAAVAAVGFSFVLQTGSQATEQPLGVVSQLRDLAEAMLH
ncbi:MAG: phosphotransferase [Planctomycetota bacterium]|nr:phosphotransferase [Planctomycetota bacterium]